MCYTYHKAYMSFLPDSSRVIKKDSLTPFCPTVVMAKSCKF